MQEGAVMTYYLNNGMKEFKDQIYNCLINKFQFKVTYQDDQNIIGNRADWFLGLASDYAIKIKQC